jgi:hypothetical protein
MSEPGDESGKAKPEGGQYYSKAVDPHIYGVKDGAKTKEDWIAVAWAALDQAGLTKDEIKAEFGGPERRGW